MIFSKMLYPFKSVFWDFKNVGPYRFWKFLPNWFVLDLHVYNIIHMNPNWIPNVIKSTVCVIRYIRRKTNFNNNDFLMAIRLFLTCLIILQIWNSVYLYERSVRA